MELRHIRYFLAVAEERHFSKAAVRLGINQPPLSMQIKKLEEEIGEALFDRLPHGAELTDAGRAFYESVKRLPSLADQAVQAARKTARGEEGSLNFGMTGAAALNPAAPEGIRAFRRAYPAVTLRLEEANSIALSARVAEGELDVALLRPLEIFPEGVRRFAFTEETLAAILPASHPLAKERGDAPLPLAALKGEPLVLIPPSSGTGLRDAVIDACRKAGFEPVIGQPAPQIASVLSLVAAEFGVSLVPDSMHQWSVAGVVFRRIAPPVPRSRLLLACRARRPSAPALNFIRCMIAAARGVHGESP